MRCIRRATRSDAREVFDLRLSCYTQSREYNFVLTDRLRWDHRDETDVVLLVCDETGRALSTMRGGIVQDRAEAEDRMTCSVELDASSFPALLLGRASTRRECGRSGFHSALRYHFLRSAIDTPVNSAIGLVYANAPRTNLMKELGYTFHQPSRIWDPEAEMVEPAWVAHLDRSMFGSACTALESLVGAILEKYPWRGCSLTPQLLQSALSKAKD